jgi:TRAP-type C4-dicarboxylate transport system substrate-binding protein
MRRALAILPLLCALAAPARADVVLRMAAIAPDGASWTRELKAFSREIETRTHGRVRMKWYWGAIAGDELQVLDRIKRDQLDGQAGAQVCDRLAPSLRVTRMLGLFQSWDEALYVIGRLRATVDGELRKHGFFGLVSGMGSDILFTRRPVRSLSDLKTTRLWLWNLDETMNQQLTAAGLHTLALPVEDAMQAYDDGRVDGFVSIPTGALAYQWSARSHYFTDLRFGFLPGCLVIANRAFDALSLDEQQAVRDAGAKLAVRFEDLGRTQERQLVTGLLQKQGVRALPASDSFRAEFFSAAEDARQHIPPSLVPSSLLQKVGGWLADYRAQHR